MSDKFHIDWRNVVDAIREKPIHENIELPKNEIDRPDDHGFVWSIWGELKGQLANWRLTLKDGSCVHVLEYSNHYSVHRDARNPDRDLIGHMKEDASHWIPVFALLLVGVVALGVWVGYKAYKALVEE